MTDLRKAFANEFKAIEAAAQANVDEATADVKKWTVEVEKCSTAYAQLLRDAQMAKAQFANTAKKVRRMGRMESPAVEDIDQAEVPLNDYKEAARQLPSSEESLADAKYSLETAEQKQAQARAELNTIKFFA